METLIYGVACVGLVFALISAVAGHSSVATTAHGRRHWRHAEAVRHHGFDDDFFLQPTVLASL